MTIDAILQKETLTHSDLVTLLGTTDAGQRKKLYDAAYAVKLKYIGNVDHYRGLLEFSNRCIKNCKYCGIRRDNEEVERFDTPYEDLLAMAKWAYDERYGSLTLQSGERQDEEFIAYVERLILDIKNWRRCLWALRFVLGSRRKKPTDAGLKRGPIATFCALKRAILPYIGPFTPRWAP